MSKRGMLPRFRPATLGLTAARPSIRPVKMTAPPPVPPPPRRRESGFAQRVRLESVDLVSDSFEPITEDHHDIPTATAAECYEVELDLETDMPTAARHNAITAPPSTLNRGPVTIPREEPDDLDHHFEEETQLRPVDDHVLDNLRREVFARENVALDEVILPPVNDLGVDYEALPSLEVRSVYDSYAGGFEEREPTTQAALESPVRAVPRDEGSYERMREPPSQSSYDIEQDLPTQYPEPEPKVIAADAVDEDPRGARADDSGPRPRTAQAYAAPVPSFDEDSSPPSMPWGVPPAPPAPSAPRMSPPPAGFVMGVQALRTSTPDAWGTPHVMPGQGYVPMQHVHRMQQTRQPIPTPHMMAPQAMMMAPPQAYFAPAQYAQYPQQPAAYAPPQQSSPSNHIPSPPLTSRNRPVGAQLSPSTSIRAAHTSKYSWFFAGAAFGAAFTLCALGVFGVRFAGSAVATTSAHQPTRAPTQAPTQAPASANAIVAPQAPATTPGVTPTVLPASPVPPVAQAAQVPTVGVPASLPSATTRPSAPPQRAAAPPRAPSRPAPSPRRPSGPRPMPGSGETENPTPSGGGDLGDLLGAGLKP